MRTFRYEVSRVRAETCWSRLLKDQVDAIRKKLGRSGAVGFALGYKILLIKQAEAVQRP